MIKVQTNRGVREQENDYQLHDYFRPTQSMELFGMLFWLMWEFSTARVVLEFQLNIVFNPSDIVRINGIAISD